MAKEHIVIDLASSDEDAEPPPAKKMKARDAMVHIPTKMHGVTIKPVTAKSTELLKLPKNITITKTTPSLPSNRMKIPESVKNKPRKKLTQPINKGKVINPLNQIKKGVVIQSVGNSTITKLKTPIQIKKPQINKPQPLQRLPPSITIKKTGTNMKPPLNISPKTLQQACTAVNNTLRKRKITMPPVALDHLPSTSNNPQWYMRPEDQIKNVGTIEIVTDTKEKAVPEEDGTTIQENLNNKEPEGNTLVEITIEDSPIKPPKAKRTRELSTEKVITIDDSPNKGAVAKENLVEGSDDESDAVKKDAHSKKKLCYEGDLQIIEEYHTLEIEITPMDPDEGYEQSSNSKVISLEIMEEEQASVEIAQNKQGDVSVVQIKSPKPGQPKGTSKEEILTKKPAIKSEFHPIYQEFITLCLKLENSDDMEKIIEKKIKPYYRQVPKEYAESDEFLDMVKSKITAIEAAPAKLYLYIKDIVDELNLQRKIPRPLPMESKPKEQQSFLHGREQDWTPRKQRQIKRLEITLKKLNRAIQKLENQEVNFDDEEDSVYLLTEKYKERMVRVHAKFCQLTNTKLPTEPRLIIEARPGLSTAPAKKLENFINQKNKLVFPDFHDVLRCVREANEESRLNWSEACIMEEARDLFVRCGRKIQRRRQENEWRLATSRITPNSDPAEQNEVLKSQLDANRRVANTKETKVFEEFSDKQSQMKLEAEEIDDKDAEGSPSESEEEDNEEPCSLENKQRRKERIKRLLQEISKKNNTNKLPEMEQNVSKEEIEIKSDADEESQIQTLSDDNNEIGSDMDELNLLQKLHSGSERRTSDSSDSESPLSISDTLDSSSDDGKDTKPPSPEVVSIENSSYSDDSDSEKNNKRNTNKELTKEIKIKSPSSGDLKNTFTCDNITKSLAISSSDDESSDNTKLGNSDKSVLKGQVTSDKDFECSILSETAELCEDINECAKPSDAEDERSLNSDTNDNCGSSASSGQCEELLKETNADPLLKQPDLIPRDPSNRLFDTFVMKHNNDPYVKASLKGSDSSNGVNLEKNSDTQSRDTPLTAEEAKKVLIEISADTKEILSGSQSTQIVDKFIESIKNSDVSQCSDELSRKRKEDDELNLNPEACSPISLPLENAVTVAEPRFRDECSSVICSVEVEDSHISDNSPILIESPDDTNASSIDSTKVAPGRTDVKQSENNCTQPKSTKNLSEVMETTDSRPVSNKNIEHTNSSSRSVEDDSTSNNFSSIKMATGESSNDDLDGLDITKDEVLENDPSLITQDEVKHATTNKTDTTKNITAATNIQSESDNTTEPKASSSKSTKNISESMATAHSETTTNKDLKSTYSSVCSIGADNTGDNSTSMPTKNNETTNDDFVKMDNAHSEVRQKTTETTNTERETDSEVTHTEAVFTRDKDNDDSSIQNMHVDTSECKDISETENSDAMVIVQSAVKETTDSDGCDFDSTKCASEEVKFIESDPDFIDTNPSSINLNPQKNKSDETVAALSEKASKKDLKNPSSMPKKSNETTNDNFDKMQIAQSEIKRTTVATADTGDIELNARNVKSTNNISEDMEVTTGEQVSNNDLKNEDPFLDIAEYCRTRDNSPSIPTQTNETTTDDFVEMDNAQTKFRKITDGTYNTEKEADSEDLQREILFTKDKNNDDSSMHVEMSSDESNIDAVRNETTKEEMDIYESVTPLTEPNVIDSTEIVDHSLANTEETLQDHLNVDEKRKPPKPVVSEENLEVGSPFREAISNGNLNINMEISDVLPTDTNLPQENDSGDQAQGNVSEMSVEKDCCDEEAAPRTIPSIQGTE